jgi:hypothetical protein
MTEEPNPLLAQGIQQTLRYRDSFAPTLRSLLSVIYSIFV